MSGEITGNNLSGERDAAAAPQKISALVKLTAKSLLSLFSAKSCYYLPHNHNSRKPMIIELDKGQVISKAPDEGDLTFDDVDLRNFEETLFTVNTDDEKIPAVAFSVCNPFPMEELSKNSSIALKDRRSLYATFILLWPGKKIDITKRKKVELEKYLAATFAKTMAEEKLNSWRNVLDKINRLDDCCEADLFWNLANCLETLNSPLLYTTSLLFAESETQDLDGNNFTSGYLVYQKGKLLSGSPEETHRNHQRPTGYLSISNPEDSQLVELAGVWKYLYDNSPETTFNYCVTPKKMFSFNNGELDRLPGSYVITFPLLRKFDQLSTASNTFKGVGLIILPEKDFDLTLFQSCHLSALSFAQTRALDRSAKFTNDNLIPSIIRDRLSLLEKDSDSFREEVYDTIRTQGLDVAYFDLRLADPEGKYYNFPKLQFGEHNIPPGFINEFLHDFTASEKPFSQMYYEGKFSLLAMRISAGDVNGLLLVVNRKSCMDNYCPIPFNAYDQDILEELGTELMLNISDIE